MSELLRKTMRSFTPKLKLFYKKINLPVFLVLVFILLSGSYLRYTAVTETVVQLPIRADASEYYFYARNLKDFGVYTKEFTNDESKAEDLVPDKFRNPGYSLFIFPHVKFPPDLEMVKDILWTQVLISIITIVLVYYFFTFSLGLYGALIPGCLVALSPHIISMCTYVLTETLFIFLLVLSAICLAHYVKKRNSVWLLLFGMFIAAGVLVRPTLYYFPLFLLPLLSWQSPGKIIKPLIITALGFLLVFSPWSIRNSLYVQESQETSLMVLSIHKGMYPGLMYKNNPDTYGMPDRFDPAWENRNTLTSVLNEIYKRFENEPAEYLRWYMVGKAMTLYSWSIVAGMGDVFIYPVIHSPYFNNSLLRSTHAFMHALHWVLVVMALLASVVVWFPSIKKYIDHRTLLVVRFSSLLIIYISAVHIVGTSLPRYSIPVYPFIYGLAVTLILIAIKYASSRKDKKDYG